MKSSPFFLRALGVTVLLCVGTSVASGQGRRYQPANPTLSPYLNLIQPEGVLPSYHALVRPLQQHRQLRSDVAAFTRQQALVNRELERAFGQPETIRPTGTGGWFLGAAPDRRFLNTGRFFRCLELRD